MILAKSFSSNHLGNYSMPLEIIFFQIKVIADIGVLYKMSVLLLLALETQNTMLLPIKL